MKEKYSSPVLSVDELEKADVLLSSGEGGGTTPPQSLLDNSIRNFSTFIGSWEAEMFL